ncbi:hypothetical protein OPT61_g2265 [Boeremia exigua]|uniref:Uncharacterized protein n=1 Tax=Boeremia exigua TaxID=749465 RepID=A0ACC2IMJ0_9PLEO|nr:hypothetical protein OPT61_g2265 [Boeremia exigua]
MLRGELMAGGHHDYNTSGTIPGSTQPRPGTRMSGTAQRLACALDRSEATVPQRWITSETLIRLESARLPGTPSADAQGPLRAVRSKAHTTDPNLAEQLIGEEPKDVRHLAANDLSGYCGHWQSDGTL